MGAGEEGVAAIAAAVAVADAVADADARVAAGIEEGTSHERRRVVLMGSSGVGHPCEVDARQRAMPNQLALAKYKGG